jgi:choline dehydrogenase-like flavoprotein
MASLARARSFIPPSETIDFAIIGAGVVGVAIARQLSLSLAEKTVFLIERCTMANALPRLPDLA